MENLAEIDRALAHEYGDYASFPPEAAPLRVETYGDGPDAKVDRLLDLYLDLYTGPTSQGLDMGCGTGFTLCRLAPKVASIWGFDQDVRLLKAARLRAETQGLGNAHLISGNAALPADAEPLPDDAFDLVLTRRGPNVNNFMRKLKAGAIVVQELFQGWLGLLEIFGRKSFLADLGQNGAGWWKPTPG